MGLFTPRQFLRPSEWLRVIPLAQEEIQKLLPLSLEKVESQLEELVKISLEREEEQPWYPIRLSSRRFGRLEQLLYCQPLSEEELAQVKAGPGAREFYRELLDH